MPVREQRGTVNCHRFFTHYLRFSPVFGLFSIYPLLQRALEQVSLQPLYLEQCCLRLVYDRFRQVEIAMINLLEHNAQGATVQLGQRELLLVMALIQEGRASFGCQTDTGEALDEFFTAINIEVEQARRKQLKKAMMRQKISLVIEPHSDSRSGASNA
jgi:hypothetical protein